MKYMKSNMDQINEESYESEVGISIIKMGPSTDVQTYRNALAKQG